jgi:hypothetical protein
MIGEVLSSRMAIDGLAPDPPFHAYRLQRPDAAMETHVQRSAKALRRIGWRLNSGAAAAEVRSGWPFDVTD